MNRNIQTIMELAGCTEDDAMRAYADTNNVLDAVDRILPKRMSVAQSYINAKKPVKVLTDQQLEAVERRKNMEMLDKQHEEVTLSRQRDSSGQDVSYIPHEETALQNNCDQECQLPVLQLEAQTREIVCLIPSEYSSGSP